jgi:hypothetical protein
MPELVPSSGRRKVQGMLISRRLRPRGLLLVATALGAAIMSTRAAVVQLQWDLSTDSKVSKYRVYKFAEFGKRV